MAIFDDTCDNFPKIFDDNFKKNVSLGSRYNISNPNFEVFLISRLNSEEEDILFLQLVVLFLMKNTKKGKKKKK